VVVVFVVVIDLMRINYSTFSLLPFFVLLFADL